MEIIGTNQVDNNKKTKKTMLWIIIAIVILLIVSIILYITIYLLKKEQFKFVVDGQKVAAVNDLFVFEGDTIYVSLRDISSIIDYKYYNGGYKQYSEDNTKCYLESNNEVCTFERGSDKIYKTPTSELDYEYFTIKTPIKRMNNGKLYIASEDLCLACNLKFYYEAEENKVTMYTLPYYADYYTQNYTMSSVSDNFKNQKALLYGLLIVQNVDNTEKVYNNRDLRYGIYTTDGEEIVGTKYTAIEFIESTGEFIVRTEENKVGIITSDGDTKVRPQYDDLKQIDKDLNLYLATTNHKKGVIEKNGKILIYLEYDEIGIDTTQFQNNDIKNSYLLFGNAIPVKQNGKWGMYDKKGNLILPIEYDSLGSIAQSNSDRTLNNILIIPDVNGIVVAKVFESEDRKKYTLYGIVNSLGKDLVLGQDNVQVVLETVYSVINNGREEYYMINQGKTYNIIEYIAQYIDLEELNKEEKNNKTTNEIASNEIVTNEIVTNEVITNELVTNTEI